MTITQILAAVLAAGVALGAVPGDQTNNQTREYAIPNHGRLVLKVPASLKEISEPLSEPPSMQLRLRPQAGGAFYVMVTSLWLDATKLAASTPEDMKANAAKSAEGLLGRAVEKEAPLKELRGPQTSGFYYSLTDRSPGRGEYKYMSQGIFLTGEVLTAFTILYRDPVCSECEQVVQMFAQSKYTK